MGIIKDKNGRDLVKAEVIRKSWKEYMQELYKEDLNEPNWTVVLEKTLESPLNCGDPTSPNHSWIFIGRTDGEAETPILWTPVGKNWLIWKDPVAGQDWRREEKGKTVDEIVGWHHWLNGHEFELTPGVGNKQWGLVCSCPGVANSQTRMSNWAEMNWTELNEPNYYDGVVSHLEPDILECKVKWVLRSTAVNKNSGCEAIPAEQFKSLKDDANKVLHSLCH